MFDEIRSADLSPAENRCSEKTSPEIKSELNHLYRRLLAWEESANGGTQYGRTSPLRDSGIHEIFSVITKAVENLGHYDCFSFARTVLSELGHDVPVLKLPLDPKSNLNHRELTRALERATLQNPELSFAVDTFQYNLATQGKIINERGRDEQFRCLQNELKISPDSNYLMIIQEVSGRPAVHVHGMIILGESASGNDFWILHRNDTESPPSICKLSDAVEFWVNAYSSDRFIARLSLLLSKPIDEIEPLPHPQQRLIDCALAIGRRLDSETLLSLQSTPYHGVIPYFTDCAKALTEKEPDSGNEIRAFLSELPDTEAAQRISAKLS